MENIMELLELGAPNIKFEISGEDLMVFVTELMKRGADQAMEEVKREEQFLTKKEVMDLFGVCDTTLWHWQRGGYLVPRKMGRKILYSKSEVYRLLASKSR